MEKVKQAVEFDCARMIEVFANNESHEFAVFCKVWKSSMFHHMYTALLRDIEIVHMTETIFQSIEKILFSKESMRNQKEKRIGCLYAIYAVYFKQPTERFVKFKLTLEKWQMLKTFIESLRDDPTTIQARFIFYKLIASHAFLFVFTLNEFGCEDVFNRDAFRHQRKHRSVWVNVQSDVAELNHPASGLLESVNILEGGYNEMKTILNTQAQKDANSSHQKLQTSNFMNEIKESFQKITDLLSSNTKPDVIVVEEDENATDEDESPSPVKKERIEDRRKRIRRKAFATSKSAEYSVDVSMHGDAIRVAKVPTRQSVKSVLSQDLSEDLQKQLYD